MSPKDSSQSFEKTKKNETIKKLNQSTPKHAAKIFFKRYFVSMATTLYSCIPNTMKKNSFRGYKKGNKPLDASTLKSLFSCFWFFLFLFFCPHTPFLFLEWGDPAVFVFFFCFFSLEILCGLCVMQCVVWATAGSRFLSCLSGNYIGFFKKIVLPFFFFSRGVILRTLTLEITYPSAPPLRG